MSSFVPHLSHLLQHRDPRVYAAVAAGVTMAGVTAWWLVRSRRPTAEELERRRREAISASGRITDGYLTDARTLEGQAYEDPYNPASAPEVLFYSYRLAGVQYNCGQDVSALGDRVLGYRLDLPVQVRYDPRNPGNSIVVSESWTGLWIAEKPRP